ncbi:MAG: family 43 glycosylhydrolase [Flavobacterium sp.]|nr:family 43 glycosylhydrolase [Flavobacterium sp.]
MHSLFAIKRFILTTAAIVMVVAVLFCNKVHAQVSSISVHDPVIIQQDSIYHIFCTGRGISHWSSTNLINWQKEKPVFDTLPWAVQEITGFKNHIWAPDISYYKGQYYLYYSISTFGKNNSAIGLATNATLNPKDSNYKWLNHGKVFRSYANKDRFNAIDPNFITDNKGSPWLSFGSFWSGIKLIKLNVDGTSINTTNNNIYSIASRSSKDFTMVDSSKNDGAIEAPFIYKKNKYYYLFTSLALCCRAEKSTYKIAVGRCTNITGPYLDKQGIDMLHGGGTILAAGDNNWYAVGHNGIANLNGKDYIIYHGYDKNDNGKSKLVLQQLLWDAEGWPKIFKP